MWVALAAGDDVPVRPWEETKGLPRYAGCIVKGGAAMVAEADRKLVSAVEVLRGNAGENRGVLKWWRRPGSAPGVRDTARIGFVTGLAQLFCYA